MKLQKKKKSVLIYIFIERTIEKLIVVYLCGSAVYYYITNHPKPYFLTQHDLLFLTIPWGGNIGGSSDLCGTDYGHSHITAGDWSRLEVSKGFTHVSCLSVLHLTSLSLLG